MTQPEHTTPEGQHTTDPLRDRIEAAIRSAWASQGRTDGRQARLAAFVAVGPTCYRVAYRVADPTFDDQHGFIVHTLNVDECSLFWGHYDLTEADALALVGGPIVDTAQDFLPDDPGEHLPDDYLVAAGGMV